MLEGWNREAGTHQDDHVPITPEVLRGLRGSWSKVCSDLFEACLFHTAALVALFGALCISELVAHSKEDQCMRNLLFQDAQFSDFGVVLRVHKSKTDQMGKGCDVSLGFCSESELCPVIAPHTYISLRGSAPGLLFVHQGGGPLTKHPFWTVMARALEIWGCLIFIFAPIRLVLGCRRLLLPWGTILRLFRELGDGGQSRTVVMFITELFQL